MDSPIDIQQVDNGASIAFCDIPTAINYDVVLNTLSEMDKSDFLKLTSEKGKRNFIAVRKILAALAKTEFQLLHDDDGKPYLADQKLNISLSHCAKVVTAISHPSKSVGIDIETISTRIEKLASRFLSKVEYEYFASLEKKGTYFTLCWSAKEALYKIIGKTAVDFANQLQVLPFRTEQEKDSFDILHIPTEQIYTAHYRIIDGGNVAMVYIIDDN